MANARDQQIRRGLFGLCLLPLWVLVYQLAWDRLGPDPGQYLVEYLGHTAICLLLLTLALSSAVRVWQKSPWLRYRRLLGLFSIFYASLHVLSFVAFILGWQWFEIWLEILERPYITLGMLAFAPLTLIQGFEMINIHNCVSTHRVNGNTLHGFSKNPSMPGLRYRSWQGCSRTRPGPLPASDALPDKPGFPDNSMPNCGF